MTLEPIFYCQKQKLFLSNANNLRRGGDGTSEVAFGVSVSLLRELRQWPYKGIGI